MIGRHVDLITVGLLLCGIAIYYGARQAMVLAVIPYKRITIIRPIRPPLVVFPHAPRVPFARD